MEASPVDEPKNKKTIIPILNNLILTPDSVKTPVIPLTRKLHAISQHARSGWQNLASEDPEAPATDIQDSVTKLADYALVCAPGDESLQQLQKILSSFSYFKSRCDKLNWKIDELAPHDFKIYCSDVSFYLQICQILKHGATIWTSFLPPEMLPATHLTRISIDKTSIQKVVDSNPGLANYCFEDSPDPVESAIENLCSRAAEYKNDHYIGEILKCLKTNLSHFLPHNQGDESLMVSHLNRIKPLLLNPTDPVNSFNILSESVNTGLLMNHHAEAILMDIIADCRKSKDPVLILNKLNRTINIRMEKIQFASYTNQDLNFNLKNSCHYMKGLIKEERKGTNSTAGATPQIQWHDSQEKFLDLFCKLLKDKTILIPNHRDRNSTINLISNIFKVKMVRGDGFYSPVSLAKYLREKISEYI